MDPDTDYAKLFARQAEILFTEDDLLWYRLKPNPEAELDFSFADTLYAFARRHRQLVFAAHLGLGRGLRGGLAREVPVGVGQAGRREGGDELGYREEVPWYQTIGRGYVARMFRLARRHDPRATLVLNEFGFETTNEYADDPEARQEAILSVIDTLQRQHVPLDALGVQAHLGAAYWDSFNPAQYRKFLKQVSDRGLKILITEMDVLDDGLPAEVGPRDRAVADIYADYLDVTLANPAVKALMTFGLSDRYTWLQEDYPRDDGAARRPLPYDEDLDPKPALRALRRELRSAPRRRPIWRSCRW